MAQGTFIRTRPIRVVYASSVPHPKVLPIAAGSYVKKSKYRRMAYNAATQSLEPELAMLRTHDVKVRRRHPNADHVDYSTVEINGQFYWVSNLPVAPGQSGVTIPSNAIHLGLRSIRCVSKPAQRTGRLYYQFRPACPANAATLTNIGVAEAEFGKHTGAPHPMPMAGGAQKPPSPPPLPIIAAEEPLRP